MAAQAAAACVRVLEEAHGDDHLMQGPLLDAAEMLQQWAVDPAQLACSVADEEWFQHVLQLVQQHQQQSGAAEAGASSGGGGSKAKAKGKGGKPKRGAGSAAKKLASGGGSGGRSVMEWLDTSLDTVLLSEERGIAMDVVVRMRAVADASVRTSSADVVEWRELHSSPMPPTVFSELLRQCEARSGPQLLPFMAPGPNGLACHPSTFPWAEGGLARGALARMASDSLPPGLVKERQWPVLQQATSANVAVVTAAIGRHEEESSELALFVRELGGVCEGWEELAAEARELSKQRVQPFGDKWQSMLDSFKEDSQLAKQKYDGNKRASKAAQEVRKLELADIMFKQYEEELKQFGMRWVGLFRSSLEEKVGGLLREDAAWLVDRIEGALERVGTQAAAAEDPVIARVRGATVTTLKSWKAASKVIFNQWSSGLEALEESLDDKDNDEFADARDGDSDEAEGEAGEEDTAADSFIPTGLKLKWEAASAEGWEAKCGLLDDKDFRRRLRKAESKASACMRAALQLLESLLGVPCGSGSASESSVRALGPALTTSRKRGSLVSLGGMTVLATAAGLVVSLESTVTPAMMKAKGVTNARKGGNSFATTVAETEQPYQDGVVWALDAMDDCIRRSLLSAAQEAAKTAPPPTGERDEEDGPPSLDTVEVGLSVAAAKAEAEATEEKRRREAEKKKKATAKKNQKRDADKAAQAETKAKQEAERREQAEVERQAAAGRKQEADAKRAQEDAARQQKKKEAREAQRQRRQELQRQQAEQAQQAEEAAAAATAAAAVAVVDDFDEPIQQQQRRPQSSLGPRANAASFEPASFPAALAVAPAAASAVSTSYSPEVLASLDKDLLVAICLQADSHRRTALAEQLAASNAATKAQREVGELRQMVAMLEQAVLSQQQQAQQQAQLAQQQATAAAAAAAPAVHSMSLGGYDNIMGAIGGSIGTGYGGGAIGGGGFGLPGGGGGAVGRGGIGGLHGYAQQQQAPQQQQRQPQQAAAAAAQSSYPQHPQW